VLGKALKDALRHALVSRNVASLQSAPRVSSGDDGDGEEMKILSAPQQRTVLTGLTGKPLYPLVVTALYTGLRRGELLAVRWRSIDLEDKVLRVRESLEWTKSGGVRFKATKTRAGRRDVSLPDFVVDTLREHRRQQLEIRVALGLAKLAEDALVFATIEGGPIWCQFELV
jgi:integrase